MRKTLPMTVFVVALLIGQLSVSAQQDAPTVPLRLPIAKQVRPPMQAQTFNGYAQYRAAADPGSPASAGHGFQHFVMPMDKYTHWYRPRAATLAACQRCAPPAFRPRGFGDLFAEPCDGFRMEYAPYMLADGTSNYGPAYVARQADPRCVDCDHSGKH